MKERKGISLIVLIITIIVMIIIAGVIIISLTEANIIDRSQKAVSEYTLQLEREKIQLAFNDWMFKLAISKDSNFKEFMEEALPDDTVSGPDKGPITIIMGETGNKYEVTIDGDITLQNGTETHPTALEIYFFGEDMKGKDLSKIIDGDTFVDDESTEIDEGKVLEIVRSVGNNYILRDITDINNIILYELGIEEYLNNETGENSKKTSPDLGIIKIIESSNLGTNVGKIVRYDNKLWTIIYDDTTNGLQMICDEGYLYNGKMFLMNANTPAITDWDALLIDADLDKSGDLTDFEKTAYVYNNAVDILNTACESVVPKNNENILDVRSAGSNPVNKELDNDTLYTSELLATIPQNSEVYPEGIANGKLKVSPKRIINRDTLLLNEDRYRLTILYWFSDMQDDYKYSNIWMPRRDIREEKDGEMFGDTVEFLLETSVVMAIYSDRINVLGGMPNYLAPVVKLNPNIQFSGEGTVDSPYTF